MEITSSSYKNVNYCIRCGGEMILRVDREEKLRPHCQECGWIYYKNAIPAVACVVLNEKQELLIIKRLVEPHPNEWALPSGYMEINQTPEEAAIAEMSEETGLDGKVKQFLGFYDGFSPIYEKVLSLGFWLEITGGKLEAGDDAGEAKFLPIDKLPKLAFHAHTYFVERIKEILEKREKNRITNEH